MNLLREKGLCLEYFRIKNNISINSFISNEYSVCDYKTYQKVIKGQCKVNEIYDCLFEINDIYYLESDSLQKSIDEISMQLYEATEFLYINEVAQQLYRTINVLNIEENMYPYIIIKEFIQDFLGFYTYEKTDLADKIKLYKMILLMFSNELQICFYELYNRFVHITTQDVNEIAKMVSEIPTEVYNKPIILKQLMDCKKFQGDFQTSLKYAEELEKISLNKKMIICF